MGRCGVGNAAGPCGPALCLAGLGGGSGRGGAEWSQLLGPRGPPGFCDIATPGAARGGLLSCSSAKCKYGLSACLAFSFFPCTLCCAVLLVRVLVDQHPEANETNCASRAVAQTHAAHEAPVCSLLCLLSTV